MEPDTAATQLGPGCVQAQVVIVGAGPTGLTLALLLSRVGVRTVVVEQSDEPQPHPAACILDTRTMEVFREIGIAPAVLDNCQNVFERARITWVTSLAGHELGSLSALPDDLAATLALSPVHATVFPQNRLEPILWRRVREDPLVTFLPGHACVKVLEAEDAVACEIVGSPGGARHVSGAYLVACDGAASPVRKHVGIAARGRVLQHMIGLYFTADLGSLVNHRKSILYWTFSPEALGVLIAHWLPDEWVLFVPYYPPQQSPTDFSEGRCRALVEAAVGRRTGDLDVRLVRPWVMAATLAARFRRGRVFLAGDAAHAFPPTGGLGLNTGVQDVHNLAWKLAAVIAGNAGDGLLDTYDQERRPVTGANLNHSERNFEKMNELLRVVGLDLKNQRRLQWLQNSSVFRRLPAAWQKAAVERVLRVGHGRLSVLTAASARGARARAAFRQRIPGQVKHYRFTGLDLGFTYDRGAFVAEPSSKPVASDPVTDYRPTTWPSARLPHFWVVAGGARISIHDALAPDAFTLLTHSAGDEAWRTACNAIIEKEGLPLRQISIGGDQTADVIDVAGAWVALSEVEPTGAILVRPDGHVAWRVRSATETPEARIADVVNDLLYRQA